MRYVTRYTNLINDLSGPLLPPGPVSAHVDYADWLRLPLPSRRIRTWGGPRMKKKYIETETGQNQKKMCRHNRVAPHLAEQRMSRGPSDGGRLFDQESWQPIGCAIDPDFDGIDDPPYGNARPDDGSLNNRLLSTNSRTGQEPDCCRWNSNKCFEDH